MSVLERELTPKSARPGDEWTFCAVVSLMKGSSCCQQGGADGWEIVFWRDDILVWSLLGLLGFEEKLESEEEESLLLFVGGGEGGGGGGVVGGELVAGGGEEGQGPSPLLLLLLLLLSAAAWGWGGFEPDDEARCLASLSTTNEPKGAVSSDTIDPIIGFLLLRCWEFNNEFDCWPSKNIDEDEDEEQ